MDEALEFIVWGFSDEHFWIVGLGVLRDRLYLVLLVQCMVPRMQPRKVERII